MKKQELRKVYKEKRQNLPEHIIQEYQENIYNQISELDILQIKNVHIFLSLKKFKEIDTQPIINFFREKKKKIVVSKCNFKENSLSHFYLEENTSIELNKFGVPEPKNAIQVDEKELDLVFVPLLISDEQNYRVGYGGGFYDRFLAKCRMHTQFIGLNFFKPILKITDINTFDIALNKVIYPI